MPPMPDVEAGETTPLVGSSADEPPPLQDMKAESLKERIVMAVGGVSCKYILHCVISSERVAVVFFPL